MTPFSTLPWEILFRPFHSWHYYLQDWITNTSLDNSRHWLATSCWCKENSSCGLENDSSTWPSDMEAPLKKMSEAGVSSTSKRMAWGEGGRAINIGTSNDNAGHQQGTRISYVFEHGRDLDVALFPSWLQGIMSKSVKKSESSLFDPCGWLPIWDFVDGDILGRR